MPTPSEIASRNAETAAPANTIRRGESPPFFTIPIPNTIIAPTAAPIKQANVK